MYLEPDGNGPECVSSMRDGRHATLLQPSAFPSHPSVIYSHIPVRVRLDAERAISVAGSDLREIDLASSIRHVVIN
jgi:hypothetical protein